MNPFEFYNPTRVVFGAGNIAKTGIYASEYGKKALVVTSRGSIVKLGILDSVKASLKQSGLTCIDFIGVTPNPRLDTVIKGTRKCREEKADVIVAVGGGSVIDCAKAIAFCVHDSGDPWDFFNGKRAPQNALPMIAVLTASGTGSEMNMNCVITNETLGQKYVARTHLAAPKVSIIDPELMVSVPKYLTACGMVDTISHVTEKYFDGTQGTPLQDRIAEGVVITVMENDTVLNDLSNVEKRGILAWTSAIALNGIADAGRGYGAFDAHTIELEVSAKYDVAHGAGLAAVHPAWMRHLCRKNPAKFARFAKRVFNMDTARSSELEAGLAAIGALSDKFKSWGMPVTLRELGVPKEDIAGLAAAAVKSPKGASLSEEDVYNVLLDCYE